MACRIQNLSKHRLALDLRGGDVVYLNPGEMSRPLREELLYSNVHLPRWLSQGLVKRMDARMSEVLEHEERAAVGPAAAPPPVTRVEPTGKEESTAEDGAAQSDESDEPELRVRTKDGGPKADK